MPVAYHLQRGSRLVIEAGTSQDPVYSGLRFEVSGVSCTDIGQAVNLSRTAVTNVNFSGVSFPTPLSKLNFSGLGIVHNVGSGLFVTDVQTPGDTTFVTAAQQDLLGATTPFTILPAGSILQLTSTTRQTASLLIADVIGGGQYLVTAITSGTSIPQAFPDTIPIRDGVSLAYLQSGLKATSPQASLLLPTPQGYVAPTSLQYAAAVGLCTSGLLHGVAPAGVNLSGLVIEAVTRTQAGYRTQSTTAIAQAIVAASAQTTISNITRVADLLAKAQPTEIVRTLPPLVNALLVSSSQVLGVPGVTAAVGADVASDPTLLAFVTSCGLATLVASALSQTQKTNATISLVSSLIAVPATNTPQAIKAIIQTATNVSYASLCGPLNGSLTGGYQYVGIGLTTLQSIPSYATNTLTVNTANLVAVALGALVSGVPTSDIIDAFTDYLVADSNYATFLAAVINTVNGYVSINPWGGSYWVSVIPGSRTTKTLAQTLTKGSDGGGHPLNNIADPVYPQDAATKGYADQLASGLQAQIGNSGGGANPTLVSNFSGLQAQTNSVQAKTNVLTGNYSGLQTQVNSGLSINVGHVLVVDAVNGVDSSGLRGRADKPYQTLGAAIAATKSTLDVIQVLPGSYTVTDSILYNGNWFFHPGAIVTKTNALNDDTGILDDKGNAIVSIIGGWGSFFLTMNSQQEHSSAATVATRNPSSRVYVSSSTIRIDGTTNMQSLPLAAAVAGYAGTLHVTAEFIESVADTATIGVFWANGDTRVFSKYIKSGTWPIWSSCNATPTGNFEVTALQIENYVPAMDSAAVYTAVTNDGSEPTAATWINSPLVIGSIACLGASKLYVNGQKLWGTVIATAGLLYLEVSKHSSDTPTFQGDFYQISGTAVVRSRSGHFDLGSRSRTNPRIATVTGGTLRLRDSEYPDIHCDIPTIDVSGGTVVVRSVDITVDSDPPEGVAQVTTVTVNGPPANGVGSYFQITTATAFLVVWAYVDTNNSPPADPGGGAFPTTFVSFVANTGDSNDDIAAAIVTAIGGSITAIAVGNVVTLTDFTTGPRTNAQDGTLATGFDIEIPTEGSVTRRSSISVSGGTLTLENCAVSSADLDLVQTGGTLNVSGGHGSGASGHFTTSGSVNFLAPN